MTEGHLSSIWDLFYGVAAGLLLMGVQVAVAAFGALVLVGGRVAVGVTIFTGIESN